MECCICTSHNLLAPCRLCQKAASLQVLLEPLEGARIGVLGRIPHLGVLVIAAQRPAVRLQQRGRWVQHCQALCAASEDSCRCSNHKDVPDGLHTIATLHMHPQNSGPPAGSADNSSSSVEVLSSLCPPHQ